MNETLPRREFLATAVSAAVLTASRGNARERSSAAPQNRMFFTSHGRTGLINADGTGQRFLEFDVPNQATWQPAGFFSDGRRVLFLSMEPRRDGPGKPFEEYFHQTPTHLWIHDLQTGSLSEIATRDRRAPFYTPQLLLSDERLLVQVVRKGAAQILSINLDGSDAREFTQSADGFPYGMSLAPDGRRVAFHLATSAGYQVWTCDTDGGNRTQVAAKAEHLYFAPQWSPDGKWLLYQDCLAGSDPGHDWCDVCISRPDGSAQRVLTGGQAMWFAASYGNRDEHGGGSNTPSWTRDGAVLFPRKLPCSRVPWEYQANRPDTDHFNREFKPNEAAGGTETCRIDLTDGSVTRLMQSDPAVWDFRQSQSPDGELICFCRAAVGQMPSLWVMNADGRNARELTHGFENHGADHPRWLPKAG